MKTRTVLLLLCVSALISCRQRPDTAPITDCRSPHKEAWILYGEGAPIEDCIALQKEAVERLNDGDTSDDPVSVLSQMGYFLSITGDYHGALQHYQKGVDYINKHPERPPTEGEIELYGNLGDLYASLNMPTESLSAFDRGIEISKKLGGRMLSDLYLFEASTWDAMRLPDSAMKCFDYARDAIINGKTARSKSDLLENLTIQRADYIIINSERWPDSVTSAIAALESINSPDVYNRPQLVYALGRGYATQGMFRKGIAMMEESLRAAREIGDVAGESLMLIDLMKFYAKAGEQAKLAAEFQRYEVLRDTLLSDTKLMAIVGADAKYRTNQKKEELKQLSLKLRMSRQRTFFLIIIAIITLAALIFFIVVLRKNYRRERYMLNERINRLLSDQKEMNLKIENMNSKVSFDGDDTEPFIVPLLLEKEKEAAFRQAFSKLYPHFLPDLRKRFPKITPGQELVCMLIYLRQSTDEMSFVLGISKASVHKSRYRLRQQLGLTNDENLDSFIQSQRP